ncbi:putative membrane protein [Tenacibaculum discolor]
MDIFLVILGFVFACLGIIGSFLPVLPGPITSWVGLLLLHLTKAVPQNWTFLGITLAIAVIIFFLDYFIPAMGTKRFGGTKYGVYGTTIGLIIGLLSPIPFGILIGAFVGALVGELIYDSKDTNRAIKASFGAFLGFLASATIKFSISMVFLVLFFVKFWKYKAAFF